MWNGRRRRSRVAYRTARRTTQAPVLGEISHGATFANADFAYIQILAEMAFGFKAASYLTKIRGARRVAVLIDSPGGDVSEALKLFDVLAKKPHVEINVRRLCLSAAAVVAMAGSHITAAANSWFMVHGPVSFCVGNSRELPRGRRADRVRRTAEAVFTRRCARRDVRKWLRRGQWWFSAKDAVSVGLADAIGEPEPPAPAPDDPAPPECIDADLQSIARIILARLRESFATGASFENLLAEFYPQGQRHSGTPPDAPGCATAAPW